jgi:hypothetical protein
MNYSLTCKYGKGLARHECSLGFLHLDSNVSPAPWLCRLSFLRVLRPASAPVRLQMKLVREPRAGSGEKENGEQGL